MADNGSTDGTLSLLRELEHELPVHVAIDSLVAYHQGHKMTALAHAARRAGADWIVPFDADEFWFAREATTVAEFLRRQANAVIAYAPMHNLFPFDDLTGDPRAARLQFDTATFPKSKIAFRAHRLAQLDVGNHTVARGKPRVDGLTVLHLPWRSFDQLRRKVDQGKSALDAAEHHPRVAAHWRQMSERDDHELNEMWRRLRACEPLPNTWSAVGPMIAGTPLDGSWRQMVPSQHPSC